MANTYIKPSKVVDTTLGLLQQEIVLPNLLWKWPVEAFAHSEGDTIDVRLPGLATARDYDLRAAVADRTITTDEITQTKVPVTLSKVAYSAVPVTHEEYLLDITSFANEIGIPQADAVARKLEDWAVDMVSDVEYHTDNVLEFDTTDPQGTALDARMILNDLGVPSRDRFAICGSAVARSLLGNSDFNNAATVGTDVALRALSDAELRRAAQFAFYEVPALDSNTCIFMHRSAFIMATGAPAMVSDGVTCAASTYAGMSMRWIRAYNPQIGQSTSMFDAIAGFKAVTDGPVVTTNPTMVRAVKATITT